MTGAVISPCGAYRYELYRTLPGLTGKSAVFIGVNPSTADAVLDDATVRKWTGFCRTWNLSSFRVINLFAYRATDVRQLALVDDPIGPHNNDKIKDVLDSRGYGDMIVPCWGSSAKIPDRLRGRISYMRSMLDGRKGVYTFGLTASGDPKHPLMLPYSTPLQKWSQQ